MQDEKPSGASRLFTKRELAEAEAVMYAESRTVRFHDVDAAGIVFYPRVLEFFSDVYVAMLAARGFDLPNGLRDGAFGAPLAHAEADYFAPLCFGDPVRVEIVAVAMGATSFRLGYRVRREPAAAPLASSEVAAVGQTVHVCIDRRAFRPIPIPEELKRALA